jgi:hypothetical protein
MAAAGCGAQSFEMLQPQARLTGTLVGLDPCRARPPKIDSRHGRLLHVRPSARRPEADRTMLLAARDACEVLHTSRFFCASPVAIGAQIPGEPDQLVQCIVAVEQSGDLRQKHL